MPAKVIARVNAIGRRTKQEVYGRNLEFLNRVKEEYEWSHEDDMDELLGDAPPEPADFPSISLATGEQMDSRAIQPDIQTEREFILASNDNQHSVFAEPRGDFDVLPNAITTGAELKDSPGPVDDEHMNEELDAVIEVNDQEGAPVEMAGEEPDTGSPDDVEPDKPNVAHPSPLSLRLLDEAIESVESLGDLIPLPAKTRDTPTLTGGSRRSTPKSSSQSLTWS